MEVWIAIGSTLLGKSTHKLPEYMALQIWSHNTVAPQGKFLWSICYDTDLLVYFSLFLNINHIDFFWSNSELNV